MSNSLNENEWKVIADSVEGNQRYRNGQQQNLFRLFQLMKQKYVDYALLDDMLEKVGVSLDVALIFDEARGGPPMASQFRPAELPELTEITPLGWAAAQEDVELVEWLLNNFADKAIFFGEHSWDAAWVAMELKKSKTLKMLTEGDNFNPNWRVNDDLQTYRLLRAVQLGYYDGVKYLLNCNAKSNVCDDSGKTALHYNFDKKPYTDEDEMIAKLLVDFGANPAAEDKMGVLVSDLSDNQFHEDLLLKHGLEKTIRQVPAPQEPSPDISPDADNVYRPEPGQPTVPQLKKPPKLNVPRF